MSVEMMSDIDEHKRVAGQRQAARKKRALTVEDLFTSPGSVSTVKAYGDFPPPPRYKRVGDDQEQVIPAFPSKVNNSSHLKFLGSDA